MRIHIRVVIPLHIEITVTQPKNQKCLKLRDHRVSLNTGLTANVSLPSNGCGFGFFTVLKAFYEGSRHSRSSTNLFLFYYPCSVNLFNCGLKRYSFGEESPRDRQLMFLQIFYLFVHMHVKSSKCQNGFT